MAKGIDPFMNDGPVPLDDSYDLFYLCGVGKPDRVRSEPHQRRMATNVHLAVRPLKGSVAAVGSVYGVSFQITDAQAIPIQPLADDFAGLDRQHTRCKNFQFCYQMFAVSDVGKQAQHEVIRERRTSL